MSRFFAVAWLSIALTIPVSAAPVPNGKEDNTPTITEAEQTRKVLDQVMDFAHEDQAINLVLGQLSETTKTPFILDRSFQAEFGIDPNELVVTVKLKQVKVRTALQTMLRSYGMTYVVLGKQIIITTEDKAMAMQMKQRLDVDFQREPLHKALNQLSRRTATNIVLDPRTQRDKGHEAPVTLQLDDVPLESVVRLVAEIGNLRAVRVGNVLFVTTDERADKLKQDQELPTPFTPIPFGPGGIGGGGAIVPVPAAPNVVPAAVPEGVPENLNR